MRYAYNTLVYGDEPIARGIARVARYGYDGVEIVGEPELLDTGEIRDLLHKHSINASSILGIYTPQRDLVSSDPSIRRAAIEYIKANVRVAHTLGAEVTSVTPTACMKIRPEADLTQEWAWAEEGLREAGEYAGEHGIKIAVEPWNRYETYLVNRMEQAIELVDRVGLPSVGCMADTFHMNIEEVSLADAIRQAGHRLYHFHAADSNRAAPGRGHIDFRPIFEALSDINYQGYISMELLPAAGDPFLVLKGGEAHEFLDQYTQEAITYLKEIAHEQWSYEGSSAPWSPRSSR